ncbi:YidB family protein [Rhizobium sp. BR 317]|uniref:YidB family protein n=1 Tax=Rhizobium sp. BR 317 TaxID=3040015 RepID=UPI0039BFE856
MEQFQRNGQGDKVESWVSTGDNKPINHQELSQALGDETLNELAAKTGLSRQEILSRLSRDLPQAVNELTPNGNVPTEKQADAWTSAQPSSDPNPGGTFA